jgi:hypothetical protein
MKSPEKPLARGPASIPKVGFTIVPHTGRVNDSYKFQGRKRRDCGKYVDVA